MKLVTGVLLVFVLAAVGFAQETLYEEYFSDGSLTLDWFSLWEDGDVFEPTFSEDNPSGDLWVGSLGNQMSGGGVGTAVAGEATLENYRVEANLFVTVNSGSYHGIVGRATVVDGAYNFYYFRADFDSDERLQLREYPGTSGMGSDIAVWTGDQVPGGIPTEDGWHHFAMEMIGDQIWVWYDDTLLDGSPFTNDAHSAGYFGVYIFNFMGESFTLADDIVVTTDDDPVVESITPVPMTTKLNSIYPNPFNPSTTISYTMASTGNARVAVYDALGREMSVLVNGNVSAGQHSQIFNASNMATGVYFVVLQAEGQKSVERMILMK